MYYVRVRNGIEQFAYTWADAVAQAKDLCDLYRERVDVRVVGQDQSVWYTMPRMNLIPA